MNLDKAIQYSIENVIKEGLNDTLPRCFELELLKSKEFQKRIQENVLKSISGNSLESLGVNRISHVLLPKNSAFDFRRCALIQPLDVIKYSALVVSLADIIERNRIPLSEKVVYSYRFKINKGFLFNRNYSISSFLIKTREKAKRRQVGFIVSCDIANFYDRLNLHRLENILLSLGCDKARVKLINEVLLFWSNRDSYGLPVGTNASRILAEAALSGVDDYLKAQNVDFIRFVDDYRFFAPDANTAHYWLTILIERLWQEGLTINKSKTKIEASEQHKRLLRNFPKNENHQLVKKNSERNPFNIRAGYGGTVPTKFRNLSEKEKNAFSQMDLRAKIKTLAEKTFIESEEILEIVKIMVSKDDFHCVMNVIDALEKYPQLTPYVIDALIKHSSNIQKETRDKIKTYFVERYIKSSYSPEYLAIAVVRILGHIDFSDKNALMSFFRGMRRNSGAYIGRALLDSLENHINREDLLEIKNGFDRSDLWEKRKITLLIKDGLNEEEARPWLKNLRNIVDKDLFLLEIANPSQKMKQKKKRR